MLEGFSFLMSTGEGPLLVRFVFLVGINHQRELGEKDDFLSGAVFAEVIIYTL